MTDESISSIFGFSLRIEYVALNYIKNGAIRVTEKRMIYMQRNCECTEVVISKLKLYNGVAQHKGFWKRDKRYAA